MEANQESSLHSLVTLTGVMSIHISHGAAMDSGRHTVVVTVDWRFEMGCYLNFNITSLTVLQTQINPTTNSAETTKVNTCLCTLGA